MPLLGDSNKLLGSILPIILYGFPRVANKKKKGKKNSPGKRILRQRFMFLFQNANANLNFYLAKLLNHTNNILSQRSLGCILLVILKEKFSEIPGIVKQLKIKTEF